MIRLVLRDHIADRKYLGRRPCGHMKEARTETTKGGRKGQTRGRKRRLKTHVDRMQCIEAYQSPQRVMSRTSCCGVNFAVRLQFGLAGNAADGVPHWEMSREELVEVDWAMFAGMFARCMRSIWLVVVFGI